jgi:hypothetical protein
MGPAARAAAQPRANRGERGVTRHGLPPPSAAAPALRPEPRLVPGARVSMTMVEISPCDLPLDNPTVVKTAAPDGMQPPQRTAAAPLTAEQNPKIP